MSQQEDAILPLEKATVAVLDALGNQGGQFLGSTLAAVAPENLEVAISEGSARELVFHLLVARPVVFIGNGGLGTDPFRDGETKSPVHGVKDMTAHVAQGSRSKALSLSPVLGVVVLFQVGTFLPYPEPSIPVESIGNGILANRKRILVAPAFSGEDPGFRYFPNQFAANQVNSLPVVEARCSLCAHLDNDFVPTCGFLHGPAFPDGLGQRFLYVNVLA